MSTSTRVATATSTRVCVSTSTRTTSMVSPLMLRKDIPRDDGTAYWMGAHAAKVKKLPNIIEYSQQHFSPVDHGYWPSAPSVGVVVPEDWRVDGCSEMRFTSPIGVLRTGMHARDVYLDEQNAFERVVGQMTVPSGGRWWTTGHDDSVTHRTAVWFRRRRGLGGRAFRRYIYDSLAPAVVAAGGMDVRAYVFTPYTKLGNVSPGVNHDYPVQHRYHAVLIFGANSRADVDRMLGSSELAPVIAVQGDYITAAHAFTVERTVPVVRPNRQR